MNIFYLFLSNYLKKLPSLIAHLGKEIPANLEGLCLPEFGIRFSGDAMIFAAGPSLDSNIERILKNGIPNYWIFAVDAAVKPMVDAGISPHFTVISDGQDHINGFYVPCDSILLHEASSNHKFFTKYPRSVMYHLNNSMTVHLNEYLLGRKQIIIPAFGSVTNCAVSLALTMGAENVYIMGCDYSYTGGHQYCAAFDKKPYPEVILPSGNSLVKTNMRFLAYSKWLEYFASSSYVGGDRIFNCTGAGILDIHKMEIENIPKKDEKRGMSIHFMGVDVRQVLERVKVLIDNLYDCMSGSKPSDLIHELVEYATGYSGSDEERKLSCAMMINELSKVYGEKLCQTTK